MHFLTRMIGSLLFLIATLQANAQTPTMRNMSIVTGGPTGTYIQFGKQIASVVKQECGVELEVKESKGSLVNLKRLRNEPFTQLAIVQEDVLDFIRQNPDDPELSQYLKNFRYIYSLYPEEVHIVARKDSGIKNLADLAGKKVAIGQTNSGTYLTATTILLRAGIKLGEAVEIGGSDAMDRLLDVNLQDGIEAMFYVAGKPVKLFAELPQNINLQLVTIDDAKVLSRYKHISTINSSDYSWIEQPVKTVGVISTLITYNFQGEQCENVGMVANLIRRNLDELRRTGHPKWQVVDPERQIVGWKRYDCAARYESLHIGAKDGHRCVFLSESAAVSSKNVTRHSGRSEPCNSKNRTAISRFACEGLQEITQ